MGNAGCGWSDTWVTQGVGWSDTWTLCWAPQPYGKAGAHEAGAHKQDQGLE